MSSKPTRAQHAADLRLFAARLERMPTVSARNPEQPLIERRALIQEMRQRAAEVARMNEPPPHGVFAVGDGANVNGRRVVLERKAPRRTGRILLRLDQAA